MIRTRHFKMASRYLAHRFQEVHPFEVEASLLNPCNIRCVYCLYPHVKTTQMTTEQWRGIIHRLGELGTLRIKFQGGEPTLRADFRELCAEAQQAGIIAAVTTNGMIIPTRPELLDYLDELIVSLDSTKPEVNDRLRGEGSHSGAVQTIDIALERGLKTIVNMVLTRENVQDLEAMLEFCEARGVPMNAQPVVYGRAYYGHEATTVALSQEQIRTAHRRLVEWKRQGRGLVFSAGTYQKVVDWPDYDVLSTRSEGESPCVAGKDFIRIEANGDLLPCCQYDADLTPKNIIEDGLEEALLHVRVHNCGSCWRVYYNERQAVFGLRPSALWEVVRRS